MILQILVPDLILVGLELSLDRNAGLVNRIRVPRNQGMPPVKVVPFGETPIGTCGRQPHESPDVAGGEANAILHSLRPVAVVPTAAAFAVEEAAPHVGEISSLWMVGVLKLD
jgi:hypothetical protein